MSSSAVRVPGRFEVTAACPSAAMLAIVTLNWTGRQISLVPRASTILTLVADDQFGVQTTARQLHDFLAGRGVEQIVVRRLSAGGPKAAGPLTMKFETMLQLMPVRCYQVSSQRLNPWVRREEWRLPLPERRLDAKLQKLQARAIETGAYVIDQILRRSEARRSS